MTAARRARARARRSVGCSTARNRSELRQPRSGARAISSATASTAVATASRNGARPGRAAGAQHGRPGRAAGGGGEARPGPPRRLARADGHHQDGRRQQHRAGHRRPGGAEPLRQPAHPRGQVGVDVGHHVEEVRPGAQQGSGEQQPGRRRRAARQPEGEEGGQQREAGGVRQPGPTGPLQPEVVGPAAGHPGQVGQPGPPAAGQRQRHAGRGRQPAGQGDGARPDRAGDQRFVPPAGRQVARAVDQVVAPADRELAGQHRGRDQHAARRRAPGSRRERPSASTVTARRRKRVRRRRPDPGAQHADGVVCQAPDLRKQVWDRAE